jgi:hypothetical protein
MGMTRRTMSYTNPAFLSWFLVAGVGAFFVTVWTNSCRTITVADGEDRLPPKARVTLLVAPLLRPRTLVFEEG